MTESVVAGILVELARLLVDNDGGIHDVVGPIGTPLILKCMSGYVILILVKQPMIVPSSRNLHHSYLNYTCTVLVG